MPRARARDYRFGTAMSDSVLQHNVLEGKQAAEELERSERLPSGVVERAFNWNGEVDNRARMPDMLAHSGGTCWKNYIHYAQIIRDKRF